MLGEEEVKKLLRKVQTAKYNARSYGSDESYRVNCRVEKWIKQILEIK